MVLVVMLLPNLPSDIRRVGVMTNSGTTSKRVAKRFHIEMLSVFLVTLGFKISIVKHLFVVVFGVIRRISVFLQQIKT